MVRRRKRRSTIVRLRSYATSLDATRCPRIENIPRRLRNSRPLAIERAKAAFDPCTLRQSSPKPRGNFRYLGSIEVGRSSIPFPAAGTIGAAVSKSVPRRAAPASLDDDRVSRHGRRRTMPRHPPTSGQPRCRKNFRGFGEDCLSVQGSSGWGFRSIARGREFRSRREFFRLEGTASRRATWRGHAGGGCLGIVLRRQSNRQIALGIVLRRTARTYLPITCIAIRTAGRYPPGSAARRPTNGHRRGCSTCRR